MTNDPQEYLNKSEYFEFDHPSIERLSKLVQGTTDKERAISIYYLVRDGIKYNPYTFLDGTSSLSATYAAETGEAFCIPKSALMVALCRKHGVPARIGFADVKNHLSSPKLLEQLKTDYFTMHAYVETYLDRQWVRSTPVFNKQLCEKFGVITLEFDGETDSLLQPYTQDGRKHMEYIVQHGTYEDMPVELIMSAFDSYYPHLTKKMAGFDPSQSLQSDMAE